MDSEHGVDRKDEREVLVYETTAPRVLLTSTLRELAKRVSKMLRDAGCGPLQAAFDVAEVRERWEELHETDADAAGFPSFDAWVRARLGFDAAWWGRRMAAAERLLRISGPNRSRTPLDKWHHEAAVWACNQPAISDEMLHELHWWVIEQAGEDKPQPSRRQVEIQATRMMGRVRRPASTCARCAKLAEACKANPALAELLREHGVEV